MALRLIEAIGGSSLSENIIYAISPALPVSHCSIFALRSNGHADTVSAASSIGESAAVTARSYIQLGFDLQDENLRWLARRKPTDSTQYWIAHHFADAVPNPEYRRICYGDVGIRERLSLLLLRPDSTRIALNLYRNHAQPDYCAQDIAWMAQNAALLGAAIFRHTELTPSQRAVDPANDLVDGLPARERQLLAHLLAGRTTKEAAQAMKIATSTAITYKQRAFGRVGVRNARELLVILGNRGSAGPLSVVGANEKHVLQQANAPTVVEN